MLVLELRELDFDTERPLEIKLTNGSCTPKIVESLKEVLANDPAPTQVFLQLDAGPQTTVLRLGSEFYVDTTNGLHAELTALLGPKAVVTI